MSPHRPEPLRPVVVRPENLTAHEQRIEGRMDDFDRRLESLEGSIEGLVKAWEAAGTLLTFIKFAASIVAALGVLWAAIRLGAKTH